MIWVAWRQQRVTILISIGLVALAAVVVGLVHMSAAARLAEFGMPACWTTPDGCVGGGIDEFAASYETYLALSPLVGLAFPVLLGMFAGAPMFARDIERGTHVFSLTQSVSRTRWWLTKALVGGLPVVAAITGLGLLNAWALAPLRPVMTNRFMTPSFETEGVVIGAYTLLALGIGITAGLWLRHTVAAMAVTLALYLGVMAALTNGVRADLYQPPLYATQSLDIRDADSAVPDDAWWLRSGFHNLAGDEVRTPNHCFVNSIVPDSDGSTDPSAVAAMLDERVACLRGVGLADRFTWYQPMERFWPFQFIESGVVLLLSLALLGLGAVAVRRRLY